MRTRFLREGYLANRVNHPGAVTVLDDDVAEDGGAFLVMELLHGETVEALWEQHHGRLPLPIVAASGSSSSTCSRRRTRAGSSIATSSRPT